MHWKMCCDVCSFCLQQGQRDELLAPILFRKLFRMEQNPDRSCARVVRSSLLSSTYSSSTSGGIVPRILFGTLELIAASTALVWISLHVVLIPCTDPCISRS